MTQSSSYLISSASKALLLSLEKKNISILDYSMTRLSKGEMEQ